MKTKGMQFGAMLAAMLLVSMAFVAAASAQIESIAPSAEVNITGPHVVFFNTSGLIPLENRQRHILQGNRTSTGCQYTIELKKTKAEANITKVIRELAVNPDTCQQLVDLGTLNKPPENPSPLEENKTYFHNSTQQSSAQQSSLGSMQATMTTSWYDPVNLRVNYVYDTINFNYDSNYVYPIGASFGHDWYRPTHWYNAGWSTNINIEGNPPTAYAEQTYDHMRNDWFLATTTNVYYQPNTVKGFPGGVAVGTSNTWDDGLIAWMLHYEKTLS